MKKLLMITTLLFTIMSISAQTTVTTPHASIDVKVTRTSLVGDRLIVDLLLENLGKDARLEYNNTWVTVIDDKGNEYIGTRYNSKPPTINLGYVNSMGSHNSRAKFPERIPLRFRIEVVGITPTAVAIPQLKMGIKTHIGNENIARGYVVIKDLDVQR